MPFIDKLPIYVESRLMLYDLLLEKPCENHPICPGKPISDKDKTKSILSNMIVSLDRLTGNIANVSSFVDEMTLLSIRGAQTPLGQRNHVCTIQSSRSKDVCRVRTTDRITRRYKFCFDVD